MDSMPMSDIRRRTRRTRLGRLYPVKSKPRLSRRNTSSDSRAGSTPSSVARFATESSVSDSTSRTSSSVGTTSRCWVTGSRLLCVGDAGAVQLPLEQQPAEHRGGLLGLVVPQAERARADPVPALLGAPPHPQAERRALLQAAQGHPQRSF